MRMEGPYGIDEFCPRYEKAMAIMSRRWTGLILRALLAGTCRFNGISAYVPGLSDRLLSERLKELEAEGIVERRVYAETPVRIEYTLTEKGQDLRPVVEVVQLWANRWFSEDVEAPDRSPDSRSQA
jgi:DNA-binding HxlR family transcriptional regulator